jgi:hypothetical protein
MDWGKDKERTGTEKSRQEHHIAGRGNSEIQGETIRKTQGKGENR